jgi:hypothetical protein
MLIKGVTTLRRRLGAGDAEQPPQAVADHGATDVGRLDPVLAQPAASVADKPTRRTQA